MATDKNKLAKLAALEALAQRAKEHTDAVGERVSALEESVPTKVSQLTNDSKYQTETDVAAAVAGADHLKRKIVTSVDAIDKTAADAAQYIYMVLKSSTKTGDKYDEYMVIDGEVERVGDWSVDLSGYQAKEEGKGLSANDYTDEDKAKLAELAVASDEEVAQVLDGVFGAAAQAYARNPKRGGRGVHPPRQGRSESAWHTAR